MYYCDKCAKEKNYPITSFKSRGPCEICSEISNCNDFPSSKLPFPDNANPAYVVFCALKNKDKEAISWCKKNNIDWNNFTIDPSDGDLENIIRITKQMDKDVVDPFKLFSNNTSSSPYFEVDEDIISGPTDKPKIYEEGQEIRIRDNSEQCQKRFVEQLEKAMETKEIQDILKKIVEAIIRKNSNIYCPDPFSDHWHPRDGEEVFSIPYDRKGKIDFITEMENGEKRYSIDGTMHRSSEIRKID